MGHQLLAEFMGTALMILFGVGVHCDTVLNKTKYNGSGHLFAISTWGFGISVALFIFGNVCINPAMVLAQCMLGNIPWIRFIPYTLAELFGGTVGAIIVWVMYKDHFDASVGKIDPVTIRNIFSTSPGVRNLPRNFFSEFVATFVFITGILAIAATKETAGIDIGVGILVWAVGMGLGGTTGFAMNLARDMGPRIAHAILPIKNKADNDWQYGLLVPGIAPFFGAAAAALFMKSFWGM
ncbi:D/L-lactic acid transporter LarD [Furfurilactobacillus siliginis]|uniref:Glycerol uptake facilitator protein n=1 Tax=Furfurilactobacillus siliginis TaxID=348151 RepID=A0A0R2LD96_9LACO|nr:D/L-lactic acid transporter LarD [Furfurilactobacillus siliginis]KRN96583.1 glycerol uptake facilitator protein [Furfurilactobacillus siliginis]GEK29488.1 glycerol uptake facilitator protein [Furfurilactobacillus siliginis]